MSAYVHGDDPVIKFISHMTFRCLYSNQQIKTGKVAHLQNVYFWNGSDNGFRVNDLVSNKNIVLASGLNLIWICGNTQFQTCQYWNSESKQTSQKQSQAAVPRLAPEWPHFIPVSFHHQTDSSFSTSVDHRSLLLLGSHHRLLYKHAYGSLWLVKISETTLPLGPILLPQNLPTSLSKKSKLLSMAYNRVTM